MKRSELRRKKALKRGDPMKKVNRERKRRRRTDPETGWVHTYGPYHKWMKAQTCEVAARGNGDPCTQHPGGAQRSRSQAHHVRSIAAGGQDYGNELPLCWGHHCLIHNKGTDGFEEQTRICPYGAAERWRQAWDRTHAAPPISKGPDHP